MSVVISGAGVWAPPHVITNAELVGAFNAYADEHDAAYAAEIAAGKMEPMKRSDSAFIEKASGIQNRYVYAKDGILDVDRMAPRVEHRPESALSHQAEFGVRSARIALEAAGKTPDDIDLVIVGCTNTERVYPAIAIEIQSELGIEGSGFDMLVACSAATFALQRAADAIAAGSARAALVITPEMMSPQINYRDRDSHFIFGDVSTTVVLESDDTARPGHGFEVLGTKSATVYSSNIRSNFGHLNRAEGGDPYRADRLFHQAGRKVFKEVCPMTIEHLRAHLGDLGLDPAGVRRWWLHQANINMNQLIVRKLVGAEPSRDQAPLVLDEFANTAAAGSVIAFSRYHEDFQPGEIGVLCSFGAGYSIGSLILKKR